MPTDMPTEKERPDCPVCFESSANRIWCILPCSHALCLACLTKVARTAPRCVLCRSDLTPHIPGVTSDDAVQQMLRHIQTSTVIHAAIQATPRTRQATRALHEELTDA